MKKNSFEKFIPIGFFCGPAEWLRDLGIRQEAYPFDWAISTMGAINELIENNFFQFLDEEALSFGDPNQDAVYLRVGHKKYEYSFFHDFLNSKNPSEQLPDIQIKYKRRIERFYRDLKNSESILFIRYVHNRYDEATEIDRFIDIIKQYNSNFKLIIIKNHDALIGNITKGDFILKVFELEKDNNDVVKRKLPDEIKIYLYDLFIKTDAFLEPVQ